MRRYMLLSAALLGCAGPSPQGGGLKAEARRAVAALAAAYERGRAEELFEKLDQSRFSDLDRFKERIRQALLKRRHIVLDIRVDSVNLEGSEAAVEAAWNKTFTDEAGGHRMEDGRCELILVRRPSGGMGLSAIHGDSPF